MGWWHQPLDVLSVGPARHLSAQGGLLMYTDLERI